MHRTHALKIHCLRAALLRERRGRQLLHRNKLHREYTRTIINQQQQKEALERLTQLVRSGLSTLHSRHKVLLWFDRRRFGIPFWLWWGKYGVKCRFSFYTLLDLIALCTTENLRTLIKAERITINQLKNLLEKPLPDNILRNIGIIINECRGVSNSATELAEILDHPEWWDGVSTSERINSSLRDGTFETLWHKGAISSKTTQRLADTHYIDVTPAYLAALAAGHSFCLTTQVDTAELTALLTEFEPVG